MSHSDPEQHQSALINLNFILPPNPWILSKVGTESEKFKTFQVARNFPDKVRIFWFSKKCVFLTNVSKVGQPSKRSKEMIKTMDHPESLRSSGQPLDCPDRFRIIQTVYGFSGKFLSYPDSVWIVRAVSRLPRQSLVCPDNFRIIRIVRKVLCR